MGNLAQGLNLESLKQMQKIFDRLANNFLSLLWLDICHNGWYPELVFLSVVFSYSTNSTVVILNSSVLKIYFVKPTFENQFRDLSPPSKQTIQPNCCEKTLIGGQKEYQKY